MEFVLRILEENLLQSAMLALYTQRYQNNDFKHTIHISDSAAGNYVPATAEVSVETNGWVYPTSACRSGAYACTQNHMHHIRSWLHSCCLCPFM